MTLAMFLALLLIFATLTSMLTEKAKKALNEANRDYSANFIVCIIAMIVGIGGTAVFYLLFSIVFNLHNTLCMILMGIAVWFSSMFGYDKVTQMITQFVSIGIGDK